MKKFLKIVLTCLLCIITVVILYGLYAVVYPWITEYNPEEKTVIFEREQTMTSLPTDRTYEILSWNIGYAGLGSEMDFFYEGGKMVRPTKELNEKYLQGIQEFLKGNDSLDFLFIQEIDFRSKRSYRTNQFEFIENSLPGYRGASATNYKSAFVPSPLSEPMGKVHAGLATFSQVDPVEAYRMSTPGAYSWPTRLFMLKRCFLVSRYALDNGKSLVLFNIHNSAFDDAGNLRELELKLLREMALEEYNSGNYVVIGGDWNQNPPGWEPPASGSYRVKSLWPIEPGYMPGGWTWAFDPLLPTNRDVGKPFDPDSTACTLLDFFLVSPNIIVGEVKTQDLGFLYSDHLPVIMNFLLLHDH